MCGIAGIIDYHGKWNNIPAVTSMLESIVYRGPDESGIFDSDTATLGNVRLSIVDLLGGQQPISDTSGRFWIVFNGEIFNYPELRKDLEKKGTVFKTHSDTEVLVQLYAEFGPECLGKLNGQFSVAIWDKVREELFLARDRVGIRPLFYNLTNGILSFASEIKALFCLPFISREISADGLVQVFTFWSCLSPKTVFKNIFELSPGHYLKFSKKGVIIEKYWQLEIKNNLSVNSIQEASEQFNELFISAVRLRLRADVEVAAYLSGGIDSSTTVAYIKDIEPKVLNTFSVEFTEKDFDETEFQIDAVKYLKTIHKSVKCTPDDIAECFPNVIWHCEVPLTRTAPAPMMILSKLVRECDLKVVITGEGSDEILAGYDIFREAIIRQFWASQPNSDIRPLLLKRIYPDIPHLRMVNPAILKMFFGFKLSETENPIYSHLLRWNNGNHIKKYFSQAIKSLIEKYSPVDEVLKSLPDGFDKWDLLARAQWLETTIFMSGYLLSSQGDRMGMANSVEGRYPFLDYRVIEFCSSLPEKYKLRGLNEKYLLKKLMVNRIPDSIIKRPKQPYRAPIKSVFINNKPPDYLRNLLSETYTIKTGLFDYSFISSLINRISKSDIASEVDNMILTFIISTHLLNYQFIESNNKEYPPQKLLNLKVVRDNVNC